MSSSDDDQQLLQILNAHGQEFLSSFSLPQAKKRKLSDTSSRPFKVSKVAVEESDDEEWTGIQADPSKDEDDSESDFEQDDDEFTSANSAAEKVVVFAETGSRSKESNLSSKAHKKAFMSSKVSKLRDDQQAQKDENPSAADEEEDERTNAQNDALLHRLVHTKLLSGSLNADLNINPAQRKKALAGRVLELSGQAKLGKGEKNVREGERNKASKRVREGLLNKQKERQNQQLEEAKNLGNYHPTLKTLLSADTPGAKKHRDRGLKMGVGKFSGGMLKLSKEEISRVQEGSSRASGRGGRGGRRGNSRGRR